MGSRPSNAGMATATKAKVAQLNNAASVASFTPDVSSQHGARNVINMEIRIISVHVVGRSRMARTVRNLPLAGAPQEVHKVKADGPGQDPEADQGHGSTHSIELNSFQDHLHGSHSSELHESHPSELHVSQSFQDHDPGIDFVKKTASASAIGWIQKAQSRSSPY